MPAGVPVVSAKLYDYPRRRHAAVVHLTYVYDRYEALPHALALLIDHGDRHLAARVDVCAQAVHLADLAAACSAGKLRGLSAVKSLALRPSPLRLPSNATAAVNADQAHEAIPMVQTPPDVVRYRCTEHVLTRAERAAWDALLSPHLGASPRTVHAYAGHGELLATREAFRSVPRSLYHSMLSALLSRSEPHADALNRLLPKVWVALLGGAHSGADFVCDAVSGWAVPRRAPLAHATAVRMAAAMPPLPGIASRSTWTPPLPHTPRPEPLPVAAAALAAAPQAASARERASGCNNASLACIVVAAHKESLGWLRSLHYPQLVYHRSRSDDGLYVVPNVFHEHAVYLRYICAFYHSLPRLSIFLHGHYSSWHNKRSPPAATQLEHMDLEAAAAAGNVYRSFNDFAECWRDGHAEWETEMLAQAHGWVRELAPTLGQPPALKEAYCCTQFIVSADRIRRRPLSFWRQLLADLLDQAVPPVCKISGHVLELTWGYLLGEPANAECRKDGWGAAGRPRGAAPRVSK